MNTIKRHLGLGAVLALTLAPFANASAADRINMIMNWTADSAHLGFAVAQQNGYYAEEDLEVELQEGRGSSVAAQLVATGQADLGYADAGATLNVASQGAPVKIISTIWKSGQFGIQYLTSSGITEPKDLAGKKLAVAPGSAMVPLVPVFLKANGIAESDVEIVSAAQNAVLGLLTTGAIDAVAETPENTVVPLAAQGIEAGNMYFYNNGVPLVSLSLIAREDKLQDNPDLYQRFLRASLKGWAEAMKDPEAAVEALLETFPETENTKAPLMQGATYSFASACPGGSGDAIGVTDEATWDTVYEVMTTAMEFSGDKPITDYYSNDHLPAEPFLCP
ncbi:MAG: ABC transporter substrate-binding protein [Alphaproteobacteria bacterium]|nr:ABC transporter substrate-binding protein [Alphaproteobacteria bacterium]